MEEKKEGCPFCDIALGKVPSRRVYEDEHVVAVLDINPASQGHMILIPKKHFSTLLELPSSLMTYMASMCKQLSWAVLRTMKAQGTTIILAQGEAAGQTIPHIFFHIIPRKDQDGLKIVALPQQPFSLQDLVDVKAMIAKGMKQEMEGGA